MAKWPWIQRRFHFDFPPTKFPDLLERMRGTPARLDEMVRGLDKKKAHFTRRPRMVDSRKYAEKYVATGEASEADIDQYIRNTNNDRFWSVYHSTISVTAKKR